MYVGCWLCKKKIEGKKFDLPRKRSWNDTVVVCKKCYDKLKNNYSNKNGTIN